MSFLKIHMKKKGNKHGWCCHHSTWMALKVKALHQYSITSLEIRWYIQFDAQETFVLATCQAGEDSRIFWGGSGRLAMCPFVVEISPKTRRKSIHLMEIWPNKKNLQPPFLRPELFSRNQTLLPRLNRVGQPTKNGSKEALRKTMRLYGPYPNPRHPKTSSGLVFDRHIWGVQIPNLSRMSRVNTLAHTSPMAYSPDFI